MAPFYSILGPFWFHFGSILAPFWLHLVPLGRFRRGCRIALLISRSWGPFGLPSLFGVPFGSLWGASPRFGVPRLPLECLVAIWGPHRRSMALKYRACTQNQASQNSLVGLTDPAGPAVPAEVVARSVVRSPTSTHAGGQDDVSFTNSLKLNESWYWRFRS